MKMSGRITSTSWLQKPRNVRWQRACTSTRLCSSICCCCCRWTSASLLPNEKRVYIRPSSSLLILLLIISLLNHRCKKNRWSKEKI